MGDIKISVFCIWRDSEKHIHKTLKQLEEIESLKGFKFSYFFYENDSKDNTESILSEWISGRNGAFLSEKLNAPKFERVVSVERMKFLCDCRNKCKILAGSNDSDYSLLIDGDIEFTADNFMLALNDIQNLPKAVMATPNVRQNIPDLTFLLSEDSYYDVYPFRDRYGNKGMYFSDCPSYLASDQFNWKIGNPILCKSAFGGFALLDSKAFNKVSWSADINCDHVNMCFDLGFYGAIYCNPRNKVYTTVDFQKIDLDNWSHDAQLQKEVYDKYFT